MEKKSADVWIGLLMLAGLLALAFLAMKAGNLGGSAFYEGYPITTRFDNIGGLKVRASVRSAGVVVGRVASIKFDGKNFQATVTMNMDQRFKFPKDSSAKILTAGLLGEQYIGIEAGGDAGNLGAGDDIKLTQSAIVLENLISQFLNSKTMDKKGSAK